MSSELARLTNLKIKCLDGSIIDCQILTEPKEETPYKVLLGKKQAKSRYKLFQKPNFGWAKRLDSMEFIVYARVAVDASDLGSEEPTFLHELPGYFSKMLFDKVKVEKAIELNNLRTVSLEDGSTMTLPIFPTQMFASKRNYIYWKGVIESFWKKQRYYYIDKPKKMKKKKNIYYDFKQAYPQFQAVENSLRWFVQTIERLESERKALDEKERKSAQQKEKQIQEKREYKLEQKKKKEEDDKTKYEAESESDDDSDDNDGKETKTELKSVKRRNFDDDSDSESSSESDSSTDSEKITKRPTVKKQKVSG